MLIKIIIGFDEGSTARLQINGELSHTRIPLNRSLKQGSVLSPIPFNIYFWSVDQRFRTKMRGANISNKGAWRRGLVQFQ